MKLLQPLYPRGNSLQPAIDDSLHVFAGQPGLVADLKDAFDIVEPQLPGPSNES